MNTAAQRSNALQYVLYNTLPALQHLDLADLVAPLILQQHGSPIWCGVRPQAAIPLTTFLPGLPDRSVAMFCRLSTTSSPSNTRPNTTAGQSQHMAWHNGLVTCQIPQCPCHSMGDHNMFITMLVSSYSSAFGAVMWGVLRKSDDGSEQSDAPWLLFLFL